MPPRSGSAACSPAWRGGPAGDGPGRRLAGDAGNSAPFTAVDRATTLPMLGGGGKKAARRPTGALPVGRPMAIDPRLSDPSRPGEPSLVGRLLDHAVGLLVDHVTGLPGRSADWPFGPLVIVSAAEGVAATAVTAAAATRGATLAGSGVAVWHGQALGRDLAAAVAGERFERFTAAVAALRLVVIDRIDLVTGAEVEESLASLFDASTAAGTAWCVSVPQLPPAGLGPRCATRLGAGLVVPAAMPPAPRAAAPGRTPAVGRIIRAAARYHDVPVDAILGPVRMRTVAAARSLAMYLARRLTGRSFHSIGAACGRRDHTTVLHAVRVCGTRIARDPGFAADVERLAAALTGAVETRSPGALGRRSRVGSAALAGTLATRRRDRRRQA